MNAFEQWKIGAVAGARLAFYALTFTDKNIYIT